MKQLLEGARAVVKQYMNSEVEFYNEDGSVHLKSKCRYQPINRGTSRETSQSVYFYRDVRIQLPYEADTRGLFPNMKYQIVESQNDQLVGREGTVRWAQDSDMAIERTVLAVEDMGDMGGY